MVLGSWYAISLSDTSNFEFDFFCAIHLWYFWLLMLGNNNETQLPVNLIIRKITPEILQGILLISHDVWQLVYVFNLRYR